MARSAPMLLSALLVVGLTACFDSGKSSDDDDDGGGDGDGGGWDVGGDTGDTSADGGTTDGGDTDGGDTDGGDTDGGDTDGGDTDGGDTDGPDADTDTDGWDADADSDTDGWDADADSDTDGWDADADSDTDGAPDTGILVAGYRGEASVRPEISYRGGEEAYYEGLTGSDIDCVINSRLDQTEVLDTCDDCEWAFEVESSASSYVSSVGCDTLGLDDPSAFDGALYGYGYQSEYYISGYGYYGVLSYYFDGYGWYPVAIADFSDGDFSYDWPSGYYYYYR